MAEDCGKMPPALRVDGGASANRLLMQFQSDLMGVPVLRPPVLETTALGAAMLAGLGAGLFSSPAETAEGWRPAEQFTPAMDSPRRERLLRGWRRAVDCALAWAQSQENEEKTTE